MADLLQFVDSIGPSPTVLLDLNNRAPIYLAANGWSAPPPRLNRSTSRSASRDGDNVAASSYSDRELVITLGLNTSSQDEAAEAIQALGRLLNSEGQWLKWQPSTIEPVFFRTKRAEFDGFNEFNGQADGFREVTIRVPAEPFAYGERVEGSATIANDPTAASNPMSFVFPEIQGDVATPLQLSVLGSIGGTVGSPKNDGNGSTVIATMAAADAPSGPFWVDLASVTLDSTNEGGYAVTTQSDATAIGGSYVRYVRTGSGVSRLAISFHVEPVVPSGDYRVFARARRSATSVAVKLTNLTDLAVPDVASFTLSDDDLVDSVWSWYDLGVRRLPLDAPLSPSVPSSGPSATVSLMGYGLSTGGAITVGIDGYLFVPVGMDEAVASDMLMIGRAAEYNIGPGGPLDLYADGVADSVFGVRRFADLSYTPVTAAGASALRVVPGYENYMTFIRAAAGGGAYSGSNGGVKTVTTTVDWAYYPKYLYDRPATT